MTRCPCDESIEWAPNIPAGLDALPRQLWAFPDVRTALLRGVGERIEDWRAREAPDLGVMWLEMWAYISDVLAFYDERIANESCLRTAQRRPSLRRHVEMLGYVPKPGLGGSVALAAFAEGRRPLSVPVATGFRSEAFGEESPQVYELESPAELDPRRNEWIIGAILKGSLPARTPTLTTSPAESPTSPAGSTKFFTFEVDNFSLAKDRLVVFQAPGRLSNPGVVTKVAEIKPFEGQDGRSYVEVEVEPPVEIPEGLPPNAVKVLVPTVDARVGPYALVDGTARIGAVAPGLGAVALDAVYRQLAVNELVVVSRGAKDE